MTFLDPGYIGDQVPLDPIPSDWGNAIRDRVVHHFADAAARDAAIPSPTEGMACYLNDVDDFQVYNGVDWSPPWNLPWGVIGYAQITAPQESITTETDITGLTVTWVAVSGRYYRTSIVGGVFSSAGGDLCGFAITDGANARIQAAYVASPTNTLATHLEATVVETGLSGNTTRKARALRGAGSGNVSVQGDPTEPTFFLVEDIGPAAAPA